MLALGVPAAASAAPAPHLIDPTQTGTINIHKFTMPETAPTERDNGKVKDTTGLEPLEGVTFSVVQVDPDTYDLTTNAGWSALRSLTPAAAATAPHGATQSVTSDAAGLASASGLPLGVYLVTETSYPAGTTPGAPFLVTVPMTDPDDRNAWMYTINVYPKNSVIGGGSKTVDESNAHKVGDTVTWTIRGDIPLVDVLDGYRIVDPLDARLTYVDTAVSLTNGTALVEDTDYTLTATGTPTKVTVDFTAAGRAKLVANKSAQVQVVIRTTINAVGEIVNEAIVYPNEASFDIEPGEPGGPIVTPESEVKYGNVTIEKVNAADNTAKLEGATFQVYLTEADATAGTNPISIKGTSSWTTDSAGLLTISGLRQSDWYNGQTVAPGDTGFQYYWIVETAAPTGFELLAAPVRVTVGAVDTVIDFTVENSPSNGGFTLPFTGSTIDAGLIYGAGAAILLGAAILVIRQRRKATADA
jgi:fimbrial isopeptide formation D2 family protein